MYWLPCRFAGTYISYHLRPKPSQNSTTHGRLPVTRRGYLYWCVRLNVWWWDLDLWFPTRTGQIVARAVLSSPWGTALPQARPEIHSNLDFVAFFHHPKAPLNLGKHLAQDYDKNQILLKKIFVHIRRLRQFGKIHPCQIFELHPRTVNFKGGGGYFMNTYVNK